MWDNIKWRRYDYAIRIEEDPGWGKWKGGEGGDGDRDEGGGMPAELKFGRWNACSMMETHADERTCGEDANSDGTR